MNLRRALLFALITVPVAAPAAFPGCVVEFLRNAIRRGPPPAPRVEPPLKAPADMRLDLLAWLATAPGQERLLVDYLSERRFWLEKRYNGSGGAIGIHTRMVLAECATRWPGLDWNAIAVPDGFELAATVKFALALHDIGKGTPNYWQIVGSLTHYEGTRTQHELTLPLLETAMQEFGFRADEIALGKALVGHDLLGQTIQGWLTVAAAYDALVKVQKTTVLSAKDFFAVQTFFYSADVASYAEFRDQVFDRTGRTIVSPRYHELAGKF